MYRRLDDKMRGPYLKGYGLVRAGRLLPDEDVPESQRYLFEKVTGAPAPDLAPESVPAEVAASEVGAEDALEIDDLIEGYDALSVPKIADLLVDFGEDELLVVQEHEEANKNRKGVFREIAELLAEAE